MSVRPHVTAWIPLDFRDIWCCWLSRYVLRIQIWFKLGGKNIAHFTRRRKYMSLLPTTLPRRKCALFDWNCIRLLVGPSACTPLCISDAAVGRISVILETFMGFRIIKPTRCTNFSNLFFGKKLLHVSDRVSYRFADSLQAGSGWNCVSSWSCLQAVSKPVWHIPLLCVQWKTPDDGQRNCPKRVEFHSKK